MNHSILHWHFYQMPFSVFQLFFKIKRSVRYDVNFLLMISKKKQMSANLSKQVLEIQVETIPQRRIYQLSILLKYSSLIEAHCHLTNEHLSMRNCIRNAIVTVMMRNTSNTHYSNHKKRRQESAINKMRLKFYRRVHNTVLHACKRNLSSLSLAATSFCIEFSLLHWKDY